MIFLPNFVSCLKCSHTTSGLIMTLPLARSRLDSGTTISRLKFEITSLSSWSETFLSLTPSQYSMAEPIMKATRKSGKSGDRLKVASSATNPNNPIQIVGKMNLWKNVQEEDKGFMAPNNLCIPKAGCKGEYAFGTARGQSGFSYMKSVVWLMGGEG